jgi:hypothetical protein
LHVFARPAEPQDCGTLPIAIATPWAETIEPKKLPGISNTAIVIVGLLLLCCLLVSGYVPYTNQPPLILLVAFLSDRKLSGLYLRVSPGRIELLKGRGSRITIVHTIELSGCTVGIDWRDWTVVVIQDGRRVLDLCVALVPDRREVLGAVEMAAATPVGPTYPADAVV